MARVADNTIILHALDELCIAATKGTKETGELEQFMKVTVHRTQVQE